MGRLSHDGHSSSDSDMRQTLISGLANRQVVPTKFILQVSIDVSPERALLRGSVAAVRAGEGLVAGVCEQVLLHAAHPPRDVEAQGALLHRLNSRASYNIGSCDVGTRAID